MKSNKITYVCLGSDQAIISEEEYDRGLTKCGGECDMRGHDFVEGGRCMICAKNYASSAPHKHS